MRYFAFYHFTSRMHAGAPLRARIRLRFITAHRVTRQSPPAKRPLSCIANHRGARQLPECAPQRRRQGIPESERRVGQIGRIVNVSVRGLIRPSPTDDSARESMRPPANPPIINSHWPRSQLATDPSVQIRDESGRRPLPSNESGASLRVSGRTVASTYQRMGVCANAEDHGPPE